MTINELMRKLRVNTNTWDIPVLVEDKEIESVELIHTDDGDLRIEIKLKSRTMNRIDYVSAEAWKLMSMVGYDISTKPTLEHARKWLRNKYHIHIMIGLDGYGSYTIDYQYIDGRVIYFPFLDAPVYDSYEDALDTAIKMVCVFLKSKE